MKTRIEKDGMGEIRVPADCLWGASTQRALENFRIGPEASMPFEIIEAYAIIKKTAAEVNFRSGLLSEEKCDLIVKVCDEIAGGSLREQFPLVIWQTGSGTQTNMNVNEVIAGRAQQLSGRALTDGERVLHPNDDVNKSQSTNDTFSAAMQMAALKSLKTLLIPAVKLLRKSLNDKSEAWLNVVKVGRTHFMDAVPITLGQEFSGYAAQITMGLNAVEQSYPALAELPVGGTAVGTGLNTPPGFDVEVAQRISKRTGLPFETARNKYAMQAGHEAIVQAHAAVKQLAVTLMKIANDIRVMASGPRAGLAELKIPANEAGSSIMPGKVNPTQIEALTMVCTRVIGNDVTISMAGSSGHFELNVFKPVIIASFLESVNLLTDACRSFNEHCLEGIEPDREKIHTYLRENLMLVTALSPHIGYEKAAEIAKKAYNEGLTLRDAALRLGYVSEKEYGNWVDPARMTTPNIAPSEHK